VGGQKKRAAEGRHVVVHIVAGMTRRRGGGIIGTMEWGGKISHKEINQEKNQNVRGGTFLKEEKRQKQTPRLTNTVGCGTKRGSKEQKESER